MQCCAPTKCCTDDCATGTMSRMAIPRPSHAVQFTTELLACVIRISSTLAYILHGNRPTENSINERPTPPTNNHPKRCVRNVAARAHCCVVVQNILQYVIYMLQYGAYVYVCVCTLTLAVEHVGVVVVHARKLQ